MVNTLKQLYFGEVGGGDGMYFQSLNIKGERTGREPPNCDAHSWDKRATRKISFILETCLNNKTVSKKLKIINLYK